MSNPRVYGFAVIDGLCHEATGVIEGTFAKTKGGWDTHTVCGKYTDAVIETDAQLYPTCLRCIGRRRPTGFILRGQHADITTIDEVRHFDDAAIKRLLPHGATLNAVEETADGGSIIIRYTL